MSEKPSLYERVGGEEGVAGLVDAFYERIQTDAELAPFFKDSSFARLRKMQKHFFSAALGGPVPYGGRSMREVHNGRGISRHHIGLFIGHLVETLDELDLSEEDVRAITARINLYADEVTGDFAHET